MKMTLTRWLFLAFFACGAIFGLFSERVLHKCKPCPEIKPGVVTLYDTIYRPDPQSAVIEKPAIKKKAKPVVNYVKKKSEEEGATCVIEEIADTENCYEAVRTFSDGAQVVSLACSRAFPVEPPPDLNFGVDYQPPPIRIQERLRIDTVSAKLRRKWITLSAGPYVGYGTKGIDAGVGVQLGIKIKEW